jgi:hypothetical protein
VTGSPLPHRTPSQDSRDFTRFSRVSARLTTSPANARFKSSAPVFCNTDNGGALEGYRVQLVNFLCKSRDYDRLSDYDRNMEGILTYDRVRQVLEEATQIPPPDYLPHFAQFHVLSLAEHANAERFEQVFDSKGSDSLQQERATQICLSLSKELSNAHDHFNSLERSLSKMLEFSARKQNLNPELLTQQVFQLLKRLLPDDRPYREPNSAEICCNLEMSYFMPKADKKSPENLIVAQVLDRNTICAALFILMEPADKGSWLGLAVAEYVKFLGELLRAAVSLSSDAEGLSPAHLLLLRSFLWTSWQRCVTLCSWSKLPYYRNQSHAYIANRNVDLLASLQRAVTTDTISRSSKTRKLPASMCPWAFEMMSSDPETIPLNTDFFLSVYAEHFGILPARCIRRPNGSSQQCSGYGPSECRRFTGAFIEDQSAHRNTCNRGCDRLYWNEASYRQVQGAPAVRPDDLADGLLTYCAASEATMTVSHVWSHGQGGRPERPQPQQRSTGFNRCLHQRYSDIAQKAGCDSYWIDTACIPQDHLLRREAISQINGIFAKSRLTLICDRDLMNIDVASKSLPVLESILAVLLVCDWNVRAWTLLEGIKGARNPYILCKNDHIISLLEVTEAVYKSSRLSLGGLSLTVHHLINNETRARKYGWKYVDRSNLGYGNYGIEDSAGLLDHRHASRDGDELVIWSLLSGEVAFTPEEFWSRKKGLQFVRTAFLVSDAPRMTGVPGRSWAPIRPDLAPVGRAGSGGSGGGSGMRLGVGGAAGDNTAVQSADNARRFANDGVRSWPGTITEEGLTATWLVCRIADTRSRWSNLISCLEQIILCVNATQTTVFYRLRIASYLRTASYHWQMAFLPLAIRRRFQTIAMECQTKNLHRLALLQACSKHLPLDSPLPYRGVDGKSTALVVVEATDDMGTSWVWKKVISWTDSVPLPPFLVSEILIE